MKKILLQILTIVLLWSCNQGQIAEDKEAAVAADTVQHLHKESTDGLSLNNGAKWKADAATRGNVNNLKTIIDNFKTTSDTSLTGYQHAGVEFQKGLDKMINECRMEGPDHDALHQWLLPLLKQVKEFKLSPTPTIAAEKLEGITTQVNNYYQYFE